MSDIREQNDWVELRRHLNTEMDKRSTSSKAALWVSIGLLAFFNIVTAIIAIIAVVNTMMLDYRLKEAEETITGLQLQYTVVKECLRKAK